MPTFKLLIDHIRTPKPKDSKIYILGLMILFWCLYEGTITYLAPIVITNSGISKTLMGFIIGTSSISGALFDILICQIFKNTYFKRLFLIMFAICLTFPLILFKANSIILYLIAMSLWGIYFDLKNIANFDYISRFTDKKDFVRNFGVIQVFQSLGLLLAPIFVGMLLAENFDWKPFALAWIFLVISLFFFLVLLLISKKTKIKKYKEEEVFTRSTGQEFKVLSKIGTIIYPILILTSFLWFMDSFFWTIGPLFAESLASVHEFSGFFMVAYTLPFLLSGWTVGLFTQKLGKKKTAFLSLLIGSLLLSFISLLESQILIMVLVFISSLFLSVTWPSINGVYADYINETARYEKEIESLEDFTTNLGYIFGPMLAGYFADTFGIAQAFSILGIFGTLLALLLLKITPRKINVLKRYNAQ